MAVFAALWLLPVAVGWKLAPDLGHAWAAPVLIVYLWWERWAERPRQIAVFRPADFHAKNRKPAILLLFALVVMELPLRLLLTPFPLWPALVALYTLLFATLALVGAWLIGGRPALRWIGGPLILLISTLPIPSLAENIVIMPLRVAMATLAAEISNLVGHPAIPMGTSVRLGGGWVGIDEACGGIRSLQACIMIGLFFGEWYRFTWPRRCGLIAAAVGAALLGNFSRVLFLSLIANSGPHAVEQYHDLAGWIAMGMSVTLTGWLACHLTGYRWPEQKRETQVTNLSNQAAPDEAQLDSTFLRWPFAKSLRWLLIVIGLLGFNEGVTRWWFGHGAQHSETVLRWAPVFPVTNPSFQPQFLGESAREMLRPDNFVAGRWRTSPDIPVSAYYVEWLRGQVARSVPFLHNPTVCLPYAGCELTETLPSFSIQTPAGSVPFFAYKFRRAGEEMLVTFTIWDTSRGRPLEKPESLHSWRQWWLGQWAEVAEARQHQPAQLLTLAMPWSEKAQAISVSVLEQLIRPSAYP